MATYGQVTQYLKRPGAGQTVGNTLNKNHNAPVIPCHSVVRESGVVGGYSKGVK